MFKCKHKWKVISETETKSQAEHYSDITGKVPLPKNRYQLKDMTKRKFIQVFTCQKCGKFKRYVEQI